MLIEPLGDHPAGEAEGHRGQAMVELHWRDACRCPLLVGKADRGEDRWRELVGRDGDRIGVPTAAAPTPAGAMSPIAVISGGKRRASGRMCNDRRLSYRHFMPIAQLHDQTAGRSCGCGTVRFRSLSTEKPNLTPTSYVVLGFLAAAGPSTPYDLKKMHAGSVGNFWSVPHSQLYAEPKRLAAAGLIDERREETGRRRSGLRAHGGGRRALNEWLAEPATTTPELRDPALLQLFFGADPKLVAPARAAAHRAQLAEYETLRKAMGDEPALRGPALTLDLGIAVARQSVRYWERLAGERDA